MNLTVLFIVILLLSIEEGNFIYKVGRFADGSLIYNIFMQKVWEQ